MSIILMMPVNQSTVSNWSLKSKLTYLLLYCVCYLKVVREECQDEVMMLALWKHECTRVIADRFVSQSDKQWFEETLKKVLKEQVGEALADKLPEEPYFVDFLRDAPEMTGDEPEGTDVDVPKVYELVGNNLSRSLLLLVCLHVCPYVSMHLNLSWAHFCHPIKRPVSATSTGNASD